MPDDWTHDKSVFADDSVWKHRYAAGLHLISYTGGTPSDPKVAKGWLATRLGGEAERDRMLTARLQQTIAERIGADPDLDPQKAMDEAIAQTAVNVNGFKRTPIGLYVEGRTIKAALKEATNIALAAGNVPMRYGLTKKGTKSYVAEHVMVTEDNIPITRDGEPVTEPDEIQQAFVHTFRGSGIDYSEVLFDVDVAFTVKTDVDLTDLWPTIWTTAEENGLGARRSQGSGRFIVTRWDKLR